MVRYQKRIPYSSAYRSIIKAVSLSVIAIVLFITTRCVEPYTLEGVSSTPDFLVVDGFIDATEGTVTVKLTKALGIQSEEDYPVVAGANVSVVSEDGDEYLLQFANPDLNPEFEDTYFAEGITFDTSEKYKLRITGGPGQSIYESDFITIQVAAPIESLDFRADDEEVRIYVNSAESSSASQYFRWRYEEAFQYNSPLFSSWYMDDERNMVYRSPEEWVYTCYKEDPSNEILISSSGELTSNVIRNREIKRVSRSSVKLMRTYSLNVKQMALTEDAYTYWLNLYKTTESTGGLFDPLPGQIFGNIRSVSNPNEMVIGYFSGSTIEQKRLFISRADLPQGYVNYRAPFCDQDTVYLVDLEFITPGTIFGNSIVDNFGNIQAYTISTVSCLDCRAFLRGTTTKPEYWP